MKSATSKTVANVAATLLCLFVFVSASLAANPLNSPRGLAVDANGNLWAANYGANNILEFNSDYVLQSKVITAGINAPTGVAFDLAGNLWVSNSATSNGGTYGSISMYTKGAQIKAATITNGIGGPRGLAIDGLDNLWVANQGSNNVSSQGVTVYRIADPNAAPSTLSGTITVAVTSGIAAAGQKVVFWNGGAAGGSVFVNAQLALLGIYGGFTVLPGDDNEGNAYATAANGDVYMAISPSEIYVYNPSTGALTLFASLAGATPTGLTVDNVRGRVYVALLSSQIQVYNTKGALLTTIE